MRRIGLLLVAVVALPVALLPAASGAPITADRTRFKTVTLTFTNPAQLDILDNRAADPYPSTIRVDGLRQGRIKDVNVRLHGYNHTFPDDVDLMLVSPGGRSAFLMSDVGTNGDLFEIGGVTLILDDEAAEPLPDFGALISGRYRPTNGDPDLNGDVSGDDFPDPAPQPRGSRLAVFDDTNPNGTWRLFVVDDRSGDAGFFDGGWTLQLTVRVKKAARR